MSFMVDQGEQMVWAFRTNKVYGNYTVRIYGVNSLRLLFSTEVKK